MSQEVAVLEVDEKQAEALHKRKNYRVRTGRLRLFTAV